MTSNGVVFLRSKPLFPSVPSSSPADHASLPDALLRQASINHDTNVVLVVVQRDADLHVLPWLLTSLDTTQTCADVVLFLHTPPPKDHLFFHVMTSTCVRVCVCLFEVAFKSTLWEYHCDAITSLPELLV